jgi:hypothetical protein
VTYAVECPESQRVYAWQEAVLFRRFPSPLHIGAARVVIRELCDRLGYEQPKVRCLRTSPEAANVLGLVTHDTLRIYIREWSNKAVVLHELAHYLSGRDGHSLDHGPVFMDWFLRLLELSGHPIVADDLYEAA